MKQIENPEERDARENAEQRAFQDETERNFQKAVAEDSIWTRTVRPTPP